MRKLHNKTGYTLLELVVSIAIIAILMAVFIVSFSNFLRKAHLSHDLTMAKTMTDVLNNHLLFNHYEHLDGHDVKYILNTHYGFKNSFTPKTKHTVFLYKHKEKIILLTNILDYELSILENKPLTMDRYEAFGLTPEELFGKDQYILTTKGSSLVEAIDEIRTLGNHFNLSKQYEKISMTYMNQKSKTPQLLKILFDSFHPAHTLYANTVRYQTLATEGNTIKHVIFSEQMTNVPPLKQNYDLSKIKHIHLPIRIHTVESHGLTNVIESTKITAANQSLKLQVNASHSFFASSYDLLILKDYSYLDLFRYDHEHNEQVIHNNDLIVVNGKMAIQLELLPIYDEITNYHLMIDDEIFVKLYTNHGFKAILKYNIS
jgi:prepilin-type N-terminal cleavage/methylation domain-containing protein